MAKAELRRDENVPGDFYVDSSCIDCDTCRWMAPEVYSRAGSMSAVHRQPDDPAATQLAPSRLKPALIFCIFNSV